MNVLIVLNGETRLDIRNFIKSEKIDYIIGVDGGLRHLFKEQIKVDLAIGDFDSYQFQEFDKAFSQQLVKKQVILPTQKDETDFASAILYLKEDNKEEINCIYVTGYAANSRVEHFYANLLQLNEKMFFVDQGAKIFMLKSGTYDNSIFRTHFKAKYYSFFAKRDIELLELKGFKYNYYDSLDESKSIGISNEIETSKEIEVAFDTGELFVFVSEDD